MNYSMIARIQWSINGEPSVIKGGFHFIHLIGFGIPNAAAC